MIHYGKTKNISYYTCLLYTSLQDKTGTLDGRIWDPNSGGIADYDEMCIRDRLEAAAAIRALGRSDAKTIPIIAMTANTFKEDVEAAMAAGMTSFISKPVDVEALYHELHAAVHKNIN